MANEAREVTPYTAVAPDRETPVKDYRPVYSDPDEELHGGLTVEEVNDSEAGDEAPKGDTVTESATSSKEKDDFPKVPAPETKASSANADTGDGKSKQAKASQQTSSPAPKNG